MRDVGYRVVCTIKLHVWVFAVNRREVRPCNFNVVAGSCALRVL